jgi:hypothetical protein
MHRIRIRETLGLALLFVLLTHVTAVAACLPRDIRGAWDIYVHSNITFEDDSGELVSISAINFCQIRVNPQGHIISAAPCQDTLGDNLVLRGELRVNRRCNVRGEVIITDPDFTFERTISRATMTRDKESWSGVGVSREEGALETFTISAVRR